MILFLKDCLILLFRMQMLYPRKELGALCDIVVNGEQMGHEASIVNVSIDCPSSYNQRCFAEEVGRRADLLLWPVLLLHYIPCDNLAQHAINQSCP